MTLKDRVALVTGGSTGIGRAAAELMARQGAKVALTARRAERCDAAAAEIEALGGEVLTLAGDVSEPAHVQELVARTMDRWGRLDIVVANAGVGGVLAPIEDLTPEEWDSTQAINMRGTFLTVKYAIPHLRANGGGSIVIVSSVNGSRIFSNFGFAAYSCSKAAQVAFAKTAALELAQWGIRVNVVCPGATETSIGENSQRRGTESIQLRRDYPDGMIPLGQRSATPEEMGRAILYLASDEASYVTGTELYVDGALSLFQG